jgi:hypothetical protein
MSGRLVWSILAFAFAMMQLHLAISVSLISQNSFNISGKVVKTFLIGDEKISDSETHLQKAIENYTRALNTVHTQVSIKVLEVVNGITSLGLRLTNFHCRNGFINETCKSI